MLFHLGILAAPPDCGPRPVPLRGPARRHHPGDRRGADGLPEPEKATCTPKTVSSLATRLMHFGRFLTAADPGLATLPGLDRQRHIEPYLASAADASDSKKRTR